jgi:hypothetical protein
MRHVYRAGLRHARRRSPERSDSLRSGGALHTFAPRKKARARRDEQPAALHDYEGSKQGRTRVSEVLGSYILRTIFPRELANVVSEGHVVG